MSNKNKELLKRALNEIREVSNKLGVHPQILSRADFLSNSDLSDWDLRKLGGLAALKKRFPMTEKALKEIQEQKELVSYISKLEKEVANLSIFEEKIIKEISKNKPINIKQYKPLKKEKIFRELNLVLSDLHIGSDIDGESTGQLDFGKVEESRRLARIVKETIEYKLEHRDSTKLNVLLLGDIIQNQLHDLRDGAPLAEQAARAINLLSQAIAQLSANFREISVYCNTGNHGRNTGRHHERAVNQKWDSIETIIYYAIKQSLKNLKNVKVIIPKTPYVTYEVFGKKVFATHGDTVLKPGYPGSSIKTGSLENQINRLNASLKDHEEYHVLIVGHVHVASVTHLSNGAVMLTNGALVPVDEYAVSIGMTECTNGQYLFESVKDYPVGDCRLIKVDVKDDNNPKLDEIIKPFSSF